MATVSIIYRKDKLNKKGEAPVHFRIIKDRKVSYISSTIMLPEENWDFKNKKIKEKHSTQKGCVIQFLLCIRIQRGSMNPSHV